MVYLKLLTPRDDAIAKRAHAIRNRDSGLAYRVFVLVGEARRYGLRTEYAKGQLNKAEELLIEAESGGEAKGSRYTLLAVLIWMALCICLALGIE